jgi:hypothetical protein
VAEAKLTPLQANQALLVANGDFHAAAAAVGVTTECLKDTCKRDAALKRRWLDAPLAPPPSSLINRQDDVALTEALQREENELRTGIARLTKSDRAQQLAVTCQQFQRQNFGKVMQITGGGITKAFLEALEEIENITERLNNLDVKPEQMLAYESILREDRSRLLDFVFKAATKVDQGALIMAKMQRLAEGGSPGGKGSSKPGFTPLKRTIEVDPAA